MKRYVTLFCHTSSESSSAEIQQELMRQHDFLTQFAKKNNMSITHCFFHNGPLDLQNPDDVFSRFLRCNLTENVDLILIENADIIPIDQRNQFPLMRIYSVGDNAFFSIGQKTFRAKEHCRTPTKVLGYARHANASQINKG